MTAARDLIENLPGGRYTGLHQSVIFWGFTGSGKTRLACAPRKEACLSHVRMRYVRLPDPLARNNHKFLNFFSGIALSPTKC